MSRRFIAAGATLIAAATALADGKKDVIVKLDPHAFAIEVQKDEVAATKKYKGATIEMSGKVSSVCRASQGDVFLTLPTERALVVVRCDLKEKRIFGKVVMGQDVTIRGQCPEDLKFGARLIDCEIVKLGENPALKYSAPEMSKEWVKDKEAATKKWEGKPIIVTGEVAQADGGGSVYLSAGDGNQVECRFISLNRDLETKFKKGDKVKLVGEFLAIESEDNRPTLLFCLPVSD